VCFNCEKTSCDKWLQLISRKWHTFTAFHQCILFWLLSVLHIKWYLFLVYVCDHMCNADVRLNIDLLVAYIVSGSANLVRIWVCTNNSNFKLFLKFTYVEILFIVKSVQGHCVYTWKVLLWLGRLEWHLIVVAVIQFSLRNFDPCYIMWTALYVTWVWTLRPKIITCCTQGSLLSNSLLDLIIVEEYH
jgi:hypothetical protein